jgi:hypothetical protein
MDSQIKRLRPCPAFRKPKVWWRKNKSPNAGLVLGKDILPQRVLRFIHHDDNRK